MLYGAGCQLRFSVAVLAIRHPPYAHVQVSVGERMAYSISTMPVRWWHPAFITPPAVSATSTAGARAISIRPPPPPGARADRSFRGGGSLHVARQGGVS